MFTRVPSDYRADRRRPITLILIIVAAAYLFFTALGTLWTDFLWMNSINFEGVWQRRWGMSLVLGALGIGVSFLVLWVNLRLVDRMSPRWAPFDLTEEEEMIERFREWVEPRIRQIRAWITGGLAILLGLSVASWRDDVFLFINGQDFGTSDPIFGLDVGFYIFRLPLLGTITNWVFNLLVLTTVVVVIGHYFNGGLRLSGRRLTVTRRAKTHISILLALIALVRAVVYRIDMYELLLSDRVVDQFFGPGFTDVTARLPAYRLLILVAVMAAILFIVNIFRPGWTLALVAVGSWLVVAVAAAAIYPAIIQRLQVTPQPLAREAPYIQNSLTFTRAAWGLDDVEVRGFPASDDLEASSIEANRLTIDNLRIWDPSVLPRTYQSFQELRNYYTLSVVDTDRYMNQGTPTQVMLSVRELEEVNLPREDWLNQRLLYTHGFGAVVNVANEVADDGQPTFLLRDVPPEAAVPGLELEEPRVYFGETYQEGRPVIVKTGTEPQEVDFPLADEGTAYNEYDGEAGVTLDSIWKRLAFAFRYRDLNLLISGYIRDDSRVLVERNVSHIIDRVAPFLTLDTDPYPVIDDGRIYWVVDLYTTSSWYPYSQPLVAGPDGPMGRLDRSTDLEPGTNYMRNSVKAVVDAHDGHVTLYLVDDTDPLALAWSRAYPGLFTDGSEMPDSLVEHLRYPQDLFRLQGQLYLEYHVTDPNELFSGNDAWSLPADPATISRDPASLGADLLIGDRFNPQTNGYSYRAQILPSYLLTRLPGENDLSYLLLQPFTPRDRRNMSAFLVADSTPGRYGRLVDFRMPQGQLVDGTEQVGQRIDQDANISEQFTLWDNQGSRVIKGDLLVVPIEDSILYIQPIFLEAEGGGIPEFRRVIVVYGDQVEWAETLDGALELVFGDGIGAEPEEPSEPTEPVPDASTVAGLLDQAAAAFAAADQALTQGDLAEYQRLIDEAERLVEQAQRILEDSVEARAGATAS
jgi:uncharacterized membrane protein (UPF0182 family)